MSPVRRLRVDARPAAGRRAPASPRRARVVVPPRRARQAVRLAARARRRRLPRRARHYRNYTLNNSQ